jgi:hypothetical protein
MFEQEAEESGNSTAAGAGVAITGEVIVCFIQESTNKLGIITERTCTYGQETMTRM